MAEEAADMAEEAALAEDLAEEAALAEEVALIEDLEKCTKRPVEIVVRTVRFHSSLDRTNQSTAMIVFKIINHKTEEVQVAADMAEEAAEEADMAEEAALVEEVALTEDLEKCTKRPAGIVVKIVRFHSSQNKTNQYTAMIVFKIINQQEIRKRLYYDSKFY